jgi:hypothetical protein
MTAALEGGEWLAARPGRTIKNKFIKRKLIITAIEQ